jgi:hypothetical protein
VRILFLRTDEPDFLQDLVFHGLVRLLGPDRVLDYPPLERFHRAAPPGYRFQAMQYLDLPRAAHADRPLAELVAAADAVVVGAINGGTADLQRVLALRARRPIAVLDGWDAPYVRAGIRRVDAYFKRETLARGRLLRARLPARKLYHALRRRPYWRDPLRRPLAVATTRVPKLAPLPFGVIDTGFRPEAEVRYDVAFVGAPTNPVRIRLVHELRRMKREGFRVYVPEEADWHSHVWQESSRLPWEEYMRLLASSRICISVRGAGFDTYRYWEIPYAGSLLLAERPQTVIPDNFVDGEEAVFAPVELLGEVARRLLERDTTAIAAAGREKLLRSHTSVARAQVVLDRLARLTRV